jgi:epoxide hydrolase-like predicted phosphatase
VTGRRQALLVDFGGVLTTGVFDSMRAFCAAEGLEEDAIPHVLTEDEAALADLHALEGGELAEAEWERRFAALLGVAADGLLVRIFAGLAPDEPMREAVRAARAAGIPTALVSNSWGMALYEGAPLEELFDQIVISADVGLRKPDPEILLLAARRLGVEPADCTLVDDLRPNVLAAEALGMRAVLHRDAAETVPALELLLGVKLARA